MRLLVEYPERTLLASPPHLVLGAGLAVVGAASLFFHGGYVLPLLTIAAVDGYLMAMLWIAAVVSQGRPEWLPRLPHITTAVVALPMLGAALVAAFAGAYLETRGVAALAGVLEDRTDALYFSAVTLTTLGYGDFAPRDGAARLLVIAELASSVVMLVGAVPLLVSRLGSLGDSGEAQGERDVVFDTLTISLPRMARDAVVVERDRFAWRRFSFALTVTRSEEGRLFYATNGGEPVPVAATSTRLVIDEQGRVEQR